MEYKKGKFKLTEVGEKCTDVCEECESNERPSFHLENGYDNVDVILCKKCLNELKELLNTVN